MEHISEERASALAAAERNALIARGCRNRIAQLHEAIDEERERLARVEAYGATIAARLAAAPPPPQPLYWDDIPAGWGE